MTNQTCPTCGNQAEVTTSSEGTGCFKPVAGLKARIIKCLEKSTVNAFVLAHNNLISTPDWDAEIKEIESILQELGGEE